MAEVVSDSASRGDGSPDVRDVGDGLGVPNAMWTFGEETAEVFAAHARRSIPMYDLGHQLIVELSDFFVHDRSTVYDIGTSLGELLALLADRHHGRKSISWVGIDIEPAMVERARKRIQGRSNVSVELGDVLDYPFKNADLIISYYCLQFVAPKHRQDLVSRIFHSLNWGGGFLWFEKVRGEDARFQDIFSAAYVEYKLSQGYTPAEILAKARALKGVLEPFSSPANREILRRAGFVDMTTVFRYLCFEGVLAIK